MPPVNDRRANTHAVLDNFHYRIHEGTAWHWSHRYESVADNATIDTIIVVAGGEMHLIGDVTGGGAARVDFLQVASFTDGTSKASVNRHGEFLTHVASQYVQHTGSVNVSSGNFVETIIGGAGTSGKAAGGDTGGFNEFLLEEGTYAIRFTNVAGGAADFAVNLEWYDHTNIGTPSGT